MRLIDADKLFDMLYRAWGIEIDAGPTNEFMEMINNAPTIASDSNPPLTLDELRKMDGEPVWICPLSMEDGEEWNISDGAWALVDIDYELCRTAKGDLAVLENYGKTWLAYRHKPRGGTT